MLKISRVVKHNSMITCGCSKAYESTCGIMYRLS